MEKDSFVFRKEWKDAISGLPDEVRLEIYEAIIEYGTTGKSSDLKPMAMLAFNFAKATLSKDAERYEEKRKKRSDAGRKHKGNQYTRRKGTSVPNLEQNGTNGTNGTDNVCDCVDVYVYGSSNEDNNIPPDGGLSDGGAGRTHPKSFRSMVIEYFNDKMKDRSIKPITSITDGTRRAEWLLARRREYGDDAIFRMIDKASGSAFLNGHNQRGFTASFDWLIRPNNFPKVLEGNYDDEKNQDYEDSSRNHGAGQTVTAAAAAISELLAGNR